ncbi:hypothetical protein AB0M23_28725 [Streptomyces sp. NPDC052077]
MSDPAGARAVTEPDRRPERAAPGGHHARPVLDPTPRGPFARAPKEVR